MHRRIRGAEAWLPVFFSWCRSWSLKQRNTMHGWLPISFPKFYFPLGQNWVLASVACGDFHFISLNPRVVKNVFDPVCMVVCLSLKSSFQFLFGKVYSAVRCRLKLERLHRIFSVLLQISVFQSSIVITLNFDTLFSITYVFVSHTFFHVSLYTYSHLSL